MRVVLRDVTLKEGRDVPGLRWTAAGQRVVLRQLGRLGVREAELGSPGRVTECRPLARAARVAGLTTSGLVFAYGPVEEELRAGRFLDRVDLLMPMRGRGPARFPEKIRCLREALGRARALGYRGTGVGFPHALSSPPAAVAALVAASVRLGASRVTLYDTDGSSRPDGVARVVSRAARFCPVGVHCHDDLGLALPNSLAALQAGARIVDCTFHGLGDRCGNCALEPLALNCDLLGLRHGLALRRLKSASDAVSRVTRLRSPFLPAGGDFAFAHCTLTHLKRPRLFEAYAPSRIGARRSVAAAAS